MDGRRRGRARGVVRSHRTNQRRERGLAWSHSFCVGHQHWRPGFRHHCRAAGDGQDCHCRLLWGTPLQPARRAYRIDGLRDGKPGSHLWHQTGERDNIASVLSAPRGDLPDCRDSFCAQGEGEPRRRHRDARFLRRHAGAYRADKRPGYFQRPLDVTFNIGTAVMFQFVDEVGKLLVGTSSTSSLCCNQRGVTEIVRVRPASKGTVGRCLYAPEIYPFSVVQGAKVLPCHL
mmetsp:Transcript_1654/g.6450  ORF Transcript_1654/g.6450 Transcript_1654/m.6450 type:complete len:231 (-) Transcript_1654:1576-2268(-)